MTDVKVKVFFSYSHEDESLRDELAKHLKPLERQNKIEAWHDRKIDPGTDWREELDRQLNSADIILLLVSPSFVHSDFCYCTELEQARKRHDAGEACIIPIFLRPLDLEALEGTPLQTLQGLPEPSKPITKWDNRDEALVLVARGIRIAVSKIQQEKERRQVTQSRELMRQSSLSGRVPDEYYIKRDEAQGTSEADVLIVTVTKIESHAVLQTFEQTTGRRTTAQSIDNRLYFNLGEVNGAKVFLTQSEMGSGGLDASLLTVRKGIDSLSPTAVIMAGIAFGINDQKQAIGEILVTEQLRLYDLQRMGTQDVQPQIILRGDKPHASPWLINHFKSADLLWDGARVSFGVVLTGEKLVDNIDFREQLRSFEPEAIGGEMEGGGLYVACQDKKVDWILVKAICDWADGNKAQDKDARQQTAAQNAAAFVLEALQLAAINWQQRRGKTTKATPNPELHRENANQEVVLPALVMARRSLAILEEQAAGYGKLQIPTHLRIDLEEKRREVAELEARLRDGESNG
ncbi:TIR domain-containing protein [Phormidesmis priestleyi]|uniref:TIR domain-containing protein n=1 Tax=Phormidesmis priestleyi TaxID=268141 RepID=UPI00083A4B41|nr:TIR domain-containing protein [Phormidesmis priestleyi]